MSELTSATITSAKQESDDDYRDDDARGQIVLVDQEETEKSG